MVSLNSAMSKSFDFEGSFWLAFRFVCLASNAAYSCNVTWEPKQRFLRNVIHFCKTFLEGNIASLIDKGITRKYVVNEAESNFLTWALYSEHKFQ